MIPILFEDNATQFDSNGIGSLTGTLDANVVEKNDGTFELNLTIDIDSQYFQDIHIGSIIVAMPNNWQSNQAFVVEEITEPIDNIATVYAVHIAEHRSKLIPINTYTANGLAQAIERVQTYSLEENPFTITTDKSSTAIFKNEIPKSLRELLGGSEGSFIDTFGGEYMFDNFHITLMTLRGHDTGFKVVYGNNMSDFEIEDSFDFDESITGIFPYYADTDGTVVKGSVQYSVFKYLFPYAKTIAVDLSSEFDKDVVPTSAQLNAKAKSIVKNLGAPLQNISCSFETLSINDATAIALGDYVTVIHFGYDINIKMRVIETDFDVLLERYNSVTLGDAKKKLTDVIRSTSGTSGFKAIDDQLIAKVNAVGEYFSANGTVSVNNQNYTKICEITDLPKGIYVAVGRTSFANNGTGRRISLLTTKSSSTPSASNYNADYRNAISGSTTTFENTRVFNFTDDNASNNAIELWAWQNSSSALSTNGLLYIVRIK